MVKFAAFAAIALAVPALADPPAATPPTTPPSAAAPATISAEALAADPRMIAAIRHANAVADRKCGDGPGGIVDLSAKAEMQRCRRRIVATAKLDAEGEITGH